MNTYHKFSFGSVPVSFFRTAIDTPFNCAIAGDGDDITSIFFIRTARVRN